MDKVLHKKNLQRFIYDLQDKFELFGPRLAGGGTATYSYPTFARFHQEEDLILNYGTTMVTLKNIFFPDNQELFRFEKSGDGIVVQDVDNAWDAKRVFFGVHPCDIAALMKLDKVLLEEGFNDSRYKQKRANSIIIGHTCIEPHGSCFCNTSGSGPDSDYGFDLLLTDIIDRYYARSGTELGRALLSADYFVEPTEEEKQLRADQLEHLLKKLPDRLDTEKIIKKIPNIDFDKHFREFTDLCLTCGACNMVCPTCHCFSFLERTNDDKSKGSRHLTWDSCHYEKFAKMAGNINARSDVKARFRHRILDKYYYDAKRYGDVFCVGCGRCQDFCPANLSIREAVKKIEEN